MLQHVSTCSRLYLSHIPKLINRKDIRSARKWCSKNSLKIYKDCSGEFVYQTDFDLAYDMPLINDLRKKYQENWTVCYALYKSGKAYESLDFSRLAPQPTSYKPKGKIARKLLDGSSK